MGNTFEIVLDSGWHSGIFFSSGCTIVSGLCSELLFLINYNRIKDINSKISQWNREVHESPMWVYFFHTFSFSVYVTSVPFENLCSNRSIFCPVNKRMSTKYRLTHFFAPVCSYVRPWHETLTFRCKRCVFCIFCHPNKVISRLLT